MSYNQIFFWFKTIKNRAASKMLGKLWGGEIIDCDALYMYNSI